MLVLLCSPTVVNFVLRVSITCTNSSSVSSHRLLPVNTHSELGELWVGLQSGDPGTLILALTPTSNLERIRDPPLAVETHVPIRGGN
jgi:hypothetical protein